MAASRSRTRTRGAGAALLAPTPAQQAAAKVIAGEVVAEPPVEAPEPAEPAEESLEAVAAAEAAIADVEALEDPQEPTEAPEEPQEPEDPQEAAFLAYKALVAAMPDDEERFVATGRAPKVKVCNHPLEAGQVVPGAAAFPRLQSWLDAGLIRRG